MDPVEDMHPSTPCAVKKLFKVCKANGSERKCVVAASYDDLLSVIRRKYQLNVEFRVVLEEDDAEIDDECFPHLPQFTKLKFIPLAKRKRVGSVSSSAAGGGKSNVSAATATVEASNAAPTDPVAPRKYPSSLQIFVRTWTGRTLVLEVSLNDVVETVKEMIHEKMNLPPDVFRLGLTYQSRILDDRYILADYDVQNNANMEARFYVR